MRCGDTGSLVSSQAEQNSQAVGGMSFAQGNEIFQNIGSAVARVDKTELLVPKKLFKRVLGNMD